jgi:hypothetical protein
MRSVPPTFSLHAVTLASALALAACGGGGGGSSAGSAAGASSSSSSGSSSSSASTLSGSVAVGAPIANGTLRVLDASGAVVASEVTVDAEGRYDGLALSGTGPWRIEACGYAGPNYKCVYSVATAGGTANVTPLTTATVLLAAGQSPEQLMSGSAPALTPSTIAAAQDQLRSSLASVLASAGVSGTLDFVSSPLAAGSRTGYDGVLDAVGVSIGQDDHPFVQITPRLGDGNLYLEQGSTSGTVTAAPSAAALQLGGLETLFRGMTAALASAEACTSSSTGIRQYLAPTARMSIGDGGSAQGADAVATGLCGFFARGDDGSTPMWGAKLLSPTLGRCDLTGAQPVCRVSFVLQDVDGAVKPVGSGMAVTQVAGAWKFMGDLLPLELHASAKAQRSVRADGSDRQLRYDRALAFDIAAVPGLQCATVSQRDAAGVGTVIGIYKRYPGTGVPRLSLWTLDGWGNRASLDASTGFLRSADDTWISLPEGTEGDAVIRNFYRGGRSATVSLYADAACSTPYALDGQSSFEVEVEGVPPVWSAMPTLPWPEIDAGTVSALSALALEADASTSLHAAWTFANGPLGLDDLTVCGNLGSCGDMGLGRLGSRSLRPGAADGTLALHNRASAPVAAADSKTLSLSGRTGEGLDLQSNYSVCTGQPSGQSCH